MIGNLIQKPTRVRNNPVSLTGRINIGKKINFTSERLYEVKFKDSNLNEFRDAHIALLDNSNRKDVDAVKKLDESWKGAKYIFEILKQFLQNNPKRIIMTLELDHPDLLLDKRIKCIASLSKKYSELYMSFIQTDPDSKYGQDNRAFSGAGRSLLLGICKYALANKITCLHLTCTNDEFFNLIGMTNKIGSCTRYFDKDDMKEFIKETEEKYNITAV